MLVGAIAKVRAVFAVEEAIVVRVVLLRESEQYASKSTPIHYAIGV